MKIITIKVKLKSFVLVALFLFLCSCSGKYEKEIERNTEHMTRQNREISIQEDTISVLSEKLSYLKSNPKILLSSVNLESIMFSTDDNSLSRIRSIYEDLRKYYPNCEEMPRVKEVWEYREMKAEEKAVFASLKVTHDDFKNITWYETNRFKNCQGSNYISLYIACAGEPVEYDSGMPENVPSLRFKVNYAGDYLELTAVQLYCDDKVFSIKPGFFEDVIDFGFGLLEDSWASMDVPASDYSGLTNFLRKCIDGKNVKIRLVGDNGNMDRTISEQELLALEDIFASYYILIEKLPEYLKPRSENEYSLRQFYHDYNSYDVYD